MAGHNFKALQDFRGWCKESKSFVHGALHKGLYKTPCEIFDGVFHYEVAPESVGVYTGKDDKDGTPIFAGLPEDGNIGGDVVESTLFSGLKLKNNVVFSNLKFYPYGAYKIIEVIGTQYEQHLKETKCQ